MSPRYPHANRLQLILLPSSEVETENGKNQKPNLIEFCVLRTQPKVDKILRKPNSFFLFRFKLKLMENCVYAAYTAKINRKWNPPYSTSTTKPEHEVAFNRLCLFLPPTPPPLLLLQPAAVGGTHYTAGLQVDRLMFCGHKQRSFEP